MKQQELKIIIENNDKIKLTIEPNATYWNIYVYCDSRSESSRKLLETSRGESRTFVSLDKAVRLIRSLGYIKPIEVL